MFFPQNGADYDADRLQGAADRAGERAMQDAESMTLPKGKRFQAFVKNHIGLVILVAAAIVILAACLIAGK